MKGELNRCGWCLKDDLYMDYHDTEWGVPVRDDRKMFEFLLLETFQAGLSWYTILKKRDNFRNAFFDFDPKKIASIDNSYFNRLMANEGIIRNRAKINGAVKNAQLYLEVVAKTSSFSDYMWKFVDGKPIVNKMKTLTDLQATSKESDLMSKELKKAGFAFVGSTVCYAHMQATGMVNDHLTSCFRYKDLI